MSVYNPIIPQPTDKLSASQGQLLVNFTELNSQFGVDHTSFNNSGSNGDGKHKKCTLKEQSPAPTAGANEMVLYTAEDPTTNVSDCFLGRESAGDILRISDSNLVPSAGNGRTVDGLQIRCAVVNMTSQNQVFTFSKAFPSSCIAVLATNTLTGNKDLQINVTAKTTTSFTAFAVGSSSLPVSFAYVAIGS